MVSSDPTTCPCSLYTTNPSHLDHVATFTHTSFTVTPIQLVCHAVPFSFMQDNVSISRKSCLIHFTVYSSVPSVYVDLDCDTLVTRNGVSSHICLSFSAQHRIMHHTSSLENVVSFNFFHQSSSKSTTSVKSTASRCPTCLKREQ